MRLPAARLPLSVTAAILSVACSPIQDVHFPVREPDGRAIEVDKYYSSVTNDDPGDRSFKQIQAGHVDDALATMKAQEAASPTDTGARYDLAIIYEMKGDFLNAYAEIKEANRLAPKTQMYIDEEKFIERHLPKH
jgi:hypothetical protein